MCAEMCAIRSAFRCLTLALPASDIFGELLVPNRVAFHGYGDLRRPSRLAGDRQIVLST